MIREFKIGAGHTVNMGNYNSLRIEAEVTWIVDEDFANEAYEGAQNALEKLLKQTFDGQSNPAWLAQARKSRIA